MIEINNIRIKNIYYMLSYAFRVLWEEGYRKLGTEEFENTGELFAAILIQGLSSQIKRGLLKEYIPEQECLSTPRGKIEISESIKGMVIQKKQLVCSFDEYSVNAYMNRIIKSTMQLLIKSDISKSRKKELKKLLIFLEEVEELDIKHINWKLNYNKNNQTYRMMIAICELTIKGLLQTTEDGKSRMMHYLDERKMHNLYEKFILEYYRAEHKELVAYAPEIPWVLDDAEAMMLPKMQSDIVLKDSDTGKTLIIDAKYYSHNVQVQYDVATVHSGNLYQIFTYVKNMDADNTGNVAGMLMYAKTNDLMQPCDLSYSMHGNTIMVKTLDLNQDFSAIRERLDTIAENYFG